MRKLPFPLKNIASDLSTVWIMVTVGVCCGFALNQLRDNPLPLVYSPKAERIQQAVAKISQANVTCNQTGSSDATSSVADAEVHYLDLMAFREIAEKKTPGIVLDARPKIFHRFGHVPGAISLPREEFQESYSKLGPILEKDKTHPIAIYCSNTSCEDSQMVAEALVKLKYTHIFVFKGGWSEWIGAHLPEEKEP